MGWLPPAVFGQFLILIILILVVALISVGLVCLYVALALEEKCYEEMMTKFGRLVDLESLQTLSGNRKLEELRQLKLLQETAHNNKIKEWAVRWPVVTC